MATREYTWPTNGWKLCLPKVEYVVEGIKSKEHNDNNFGEKLQYLTMLRNMTSVLWTGKRCKHGYFINNNGVIHAIIL